MSECCMTREEANTQGLKRQVQELIEQAYNRGFKAGRDDMQDWEKDQADRLIEQGRNEAWEAAHKLNNLNFDDVQDILSTTYTMVDSRENIFSWCSASEAIEKIREYEEKQKQEEDNEIRVGDEVRFTRGEVTGIVTHIYKDGKFNILWSDDGRVGERKNISDFTKTGRTFPEIVEVLKKLQEGE